LKNNIPPPKPESFDRFDKLTAGKLRTRFRVLPSGREI